MEGTQYGDYRSYRNAPGELHVGWCWIMIVGGRARKRPLAFRISPPFPICLRLRHWLRSTDGIGLCVCRHRIAQEKRRKTASGKYRKEVQRTKKHQSRMQKVVMRNESAGYASGQSPNSLERIFNFDNSTRRCRLRSCRQAVTRYGHWDGRPAFSDRGL